MAWGQRSGSWPLNGANGPCKGSLLISLPMTMVEALPINQVEIVYREFAALDVVGDLQSTAALQLTASAIEEIRAISDSHPLELTSSCYSSSLLYDGRPRYDIPVSTLELLIESRFTVISIAGVLHVSIRTVRRRMSEYGLSIRATYSSISDQELDVVVAGIHPLWSKNSARKSP